MSKVEKNGTEEVKVAKVENEGGEFLTQGGKKKKQQGGRSRNNSAGDKKYDRGRFVINMK